MPKKEIKFKLDRGNQKQIDGVEREIERQRETVTERQRQSESKKMKELQ